MRDQLTCQRADRATPVRLRAVISDHRVPPALPRLPGVQRVQEWPLGVQDALALEFGDRSDQVTLAAGKVVEQLAFAGRRAGADIVQTRPADATGEGEIGGGFDDSGTRGLAL